MMTTIKAAVAAMLRALGAAWAVRLADQIDPPTPTADDVTPASAGGPGPRPKHWWWPW